MLKTSAAILAYNLTSGIRKISAFGHEEKVREFVQEKLRSVSYFTTQLLWILIAQVNFYICDDQFKKTRRKDILNRK